MDVACREHVFDVVRVTGLVSMCLDSFVSDIPLGCKLQTQQTDRL